MRALPAWQAKQKQTGEMRPDLRNPIKCSSRGAAPARKDMLGGADAECSKLARLAEFRLVYQGRSPRWIKNAQRS